jgi:hypothetical protein
MHCVCQHKMLGDFGVQFLKENYLLTTYYMEDLCLNSLNITFKNHKTPYTQVNIISICASSPICHPITDLYIST